MYKSDLLELIWDECVRPVGMAELGKIAHVLHRLLPTRVVLLSSDHPEHRDITVLRDTDSVGFELPLGDVLAEECDVTFAGAYLVAIVPVALIGAALDRGREAELVGRLVAAASTVIEAEGPATACTGASFLSFWHCYDTMINAGFSERLGIDLALVMAGFLEEARRVDMLAARADALMNGSMLPSARAIQGGGLLCCLIMSGMHVPLSVLGVVSAMPVAFEGADAVPQIRGGKRVLTLPKPS